jgi:hypothetical protein
MELHDGTRFEMGLRYRAQLEPGQTLVLTFESDTLRIYRSIGNDSGTKVKMTTDLLKKYEPNVAMWPGDVIQHLHHGEVIREEYGGPNTALREYIASFK